MAESDNQPQATSSAPQSDAFSSSLDVGWREIASAPKDAEVLLYGVLVPTGRPYLDIGRWMIYRGGYWDWSADDSQPTHWMPLPSAPRAREKE